MRFGSPRDALEQGITTIAQELSLVPARSVVENVFLGIEDSAFGVVKRRRRWSSVSRSSRERTGIVRAGCTCAPAS